MKVVTASTPDQHDYITDLIQDLYQRVFPVFFSEEYIKKLREFKLLEIPEINDLSLMETMEVTAAFQTIISILDTLIQSGCPLGFDYVQKFTRNTTLLEKYGIDFPFHLNDFMNITDTYINTEEKRHLM
ncbi:DUF5365 family protein [Sediminibacillus massiliensis]|uniref:DUF5365 family protein n=1 Tax=Sediminibacillus massiliensis TaxID=1926277 RepID=UPI0009884FE2|nr:DUF5365 family protein [Sediminibacillus massiliensis]